MKDGGMYGLQQLEEKNTEELMREVGGCWEHTRRHTVLAHRKLAHAHTHFTLNARTWPHIASFHTARSLRVVWHVVWHAGARRMPDQCACAQASFQNEGPRVQEAPAR